jgi:hypothetical protein
MDTKSEGNTTRPFFDEIFPKWKPGEEWVKCSSYRRMDTWMWLTAELWHLFLNFSSVSECGNWLCRWVWFWSLFTVTVLCHALFLISPEFEAE